LVANLRLLHNRAQCGYTSIAADMVSRLEHLLGIFHELLSRYTIAQWMMQSTDWVCMLYNIGAYPRSLCAMITLVMYVGVTVNVSEPSALNTCRYVAFAVRQDT
jgi:hypothetical protein